MNKSKEKIEFQDTKSCYFHQYFNSKKAQEQAQNDFAWMEQTRRQCVVTIILSAENTEQLNYLKLNNHFEVHQHVINVLMDSVCQILKDF
jgi:hypothetical protein